jgi:hypothetical protein
MQDQLQSQKDIRVYSCSSVANHLTTDRHRLTRMVSHRYVRPIAVTLKLSVFIRVHLWLNPDFGPEPYK